MIASTSTLSLSALANFEKRPHLECPIGGMTQYQEDVRSLFRNIAFLAGAARLLCQERTVTR